MKFNTLEDKLENRRKFMIQYASMLLLMLALLGGGQFSVESNQNNSTEYQIQSRTFTPDTIRPPTKHKRDRFFTPKPKPTP
jgi:hypothetical protein